MPSPFSLLTTRRFAPLCLAQTCGALNDNLVKNALIVLAMFKVGSAGVGLAALAGALFILPYALLSATAGQLADKFDKSRVIRWVKLAEVGVMVAAAYGFAADSQQVLLGVLFGLGVQAAMFGPLKYGILPDHLKEAELVAGNGLIEASTFAAILAGTVAGGALALLDSGPAIVGAVGVATSLAGLLASLAIPRAPAADSSLRIGWNLPGETLAVVRQASRSRPIWLSILGLSWFWAFGALLLSEFPVVARDALGAGGQVVTLLLTVFAVGVAIGSVLCALLLKGEVSARYVPFAAFGLTIFTMDFGLAATAAGSLHLTGVHAVLASPTGWRMMADLLLLAACGGLYSVPLYAIIQDSSAPSCRSRMIAANNIVNAVLMVAGAGATVALARAGMTAPQALQIAAAANLLVAFWIVRLLPQTVFRTIFQWYFRIFHGAMVSGLENVALAGERSVVVINHLSFLDGCLVASFMPGDLVFAVSSEQARRFWFLRLILDIFPVDPSSPMATKAMVRAVRDGRRLAIFPEGRITLTGGLMKVYAGPGMIADKADATVIPVKIDGLQFHMTSRMKGKLPLRWFPRVSMTVLPPRKLAVSPDVVGRARRDALEMAMHDVMAEACFRPEWADRSLFAKLLQARDLYDMGRPVVADITPNDKGGTTRSELGYGKLILASTVLGRKLACLTAPDEIVGVMLPNSVGAAVTFFGLQSQARATMPMNFSTGADAMAKVCRASGVRTIITSRRFVGRGKLGGLVCQRKVRMSPVSAK